MSNPPIVVQPYPAHVQQPSFALQRQPQWSEVQVASRCPPGLESLDPLDQLKVHQQVELLEVFTGWETANKYAIKNALGQQLFFAAEETNTCMRICCGNSRGFTFHILDNAGQEVMRVIREFKCCAGCCWCANCGCCAYEVRVEAPVGTPIGYVRQTKSCWTAHYDIMDAERHTVLRIKGPCCVCSGACCTGDQNFQVHTPDMSAMVGTVARQYSGFAKELFSNATNFGMTFPINLDVKIKATLLGAMFLIDMMFFENKNKN